MSDLISRQAAIDALGEEPPIWYDGEDEIAERDQWKRDVSAIKALPSAQPERKTGKWIFSDTDYLTHCSVCGQSDWKGYIPTPEEATKWMPICPKCGTKMEEQNETD